MGSIRIRLDIGQDCSSRPQYREDVQPPHSPFANILSESSSNGEKCTESTNTNYDAGTRIRPVLDIPYNDQTTFAHVLRDVIEVHFLGGKLLHFLEHNISRTELYVLRYSEEDATLIQPSWSTRWAANPSDDDESKCDGVAFDAKNIQQYFLQLSFGADSMKEIINPHALVSSFVKDHFPDLDVKKKKKRVKKEKKKKKKKTKKKRKEKRKMKTEEEKKKGVCSDYQSDGVLDMKLTTTELCVGNQHIGKRWRNPTNVNILLCEEHWKERCKLSSWNVLLNKTSSQPGIGDCFAVTKSSSIEKRHPQLKSFIIQNFLGSNQLLLAMAFLIPTNLIFRGLDTMDGIQLSVDKPSFAKARSLNLERPAVLRQYFGIDLDSSPDLPATGGEDAVWRSCYGVGSGVGSIGIHPRFSTTREMTFAMKMIANEIYEDLKERFGGDSSVAAVRPFNHVTVLLYYQKAEQNEDEKVRKPMLGYHTDNVYSYDGLFVHDSNSQMENTFTALLTLGDVRELRFRHQEAPAGRKRKWVSSTDTLQFSMEHGSLFLLSPYDERPTTASPNGPSLRYQHGGVKFPHMGKLSAALAYRTVTTKVQVNQYTGKLFTKQSAHPQMLPPFPNSKSEGELNNVQVESGSLAEPELDFLLEQFHRERLIPTDERLKKLWLSVCHRHL